jgi:hypothetical protein
MWNEVSIWQEDNIKLRVPCPKRNVCMSLVIPTLHEAQKTQSSQIYRDRFDIHFSYIFVV